MENGKVIALLIDAENVSPKYIKVILSEVSMYGTPAYKRIYGDWTTNEMSSWKKVLSEHNIQPIQQFRYTQGKNASDSALIIDAMDILYAKNVDGFCLVSSDSDFTRLAARLRESRMFVIGMGESKTPTAFKSACDSFKYLDVLMSMNKAAEADAEPAPAAPVKAAPAPRKADKAEKQPEKAEKAEKSQRGAKKKADKQEKQEKPEPPAVHSEEELAGSFVPLAEIVEKIREIIDYESDEDGYMTLSQVGVMLSRLYADFDSRNYGFSKLHKLIDYTKAFETRYQELPSGGKNLMIRNK